jgi:UDP-glucose 4-epimerase
MDVIVTGGAGYIGSHIVCRLRDAGHAVTVLDDLSTGHRWAVQDAELVRGDVGDERLLDRLLQRRRIDAVVHCAGRIWVGESVVAPAPYYETNTAKALRLFAACARHRVGAVVFSSTAAVYGNPATQPIAEHAPLAPINPYGASKMMAERMLLDIAAATGLRYAILRYFNVAGADHRLRTGEATPDNSHLIKVACEAALGRRGGLAINGTDYPTPDGTCVRDFIHVEDLALLHVRAIEALRSGRPSFVANCGYGRGFSVRQVLDTVREVTGVDLPVTEGPRRPGDPPVLVADARRVRDLLDWRPPAVDLRRIVASAWAFEQALDARAAGGRRRRPGTAPARPGRAALAGLGGGSLPDPVAT